MRALSLWQPWAHLVVTGAKRVENRRWPTKIRGRILIHASACAKVDPAWSEVAKRLGVELPHARDLHCGGIVGVVEIVDCVQSSADPWFLGPFGFVLRNARPLPFVPCRGRQRFFYPGPDVLGRLRIAGAEL